MKAFAPVMAIVTSLFSMIAAAPAFAQSAGLPPTNMGKFVHQPGDNQYSKQTQSERHVPPPMPQAARPAFNGGGGGGGGGWQPTPPPRREDISLLPIAADEPIAPPGFPPLPDRLDLPGAGSSLTAYGGAMPPGGMPGMAGGGAAAAQSGPPQPTGSKQGYNHYDAGAFMKEKSHGYYKCNTPAPPNNPVAQGDYYSSGGAPSPEQEGQAKLRALGREPKMNDRLEVSTTPDAPAPVVVNQARTQDLSLPEDDYQQQTKSNPNSAGKMMGRQLKRTLTRPLWMMPSMLNSGTSQGMSQLMRGMHY